MCHTVDKFDSSVRLFRPVRVTAPVVWERSLRRAVNPRGEVAVEITEVNVFLAGEAKLKAFVSLVFDGCFMINDVKVIDGRNGLFVSMPSRRKKSGQFKDVAHPLNQETRDWIESAVLEEYRRITEEQSGDEDCVSQSSGRVGASSPAAPSDGLHQIAAAPISSR